MVAARVMAARGISLSSWCASQREAVPLPVCQASSALHSSASWAACWEGSSGQDSLGLCPHRTQNPMGESYPSPDSDDSEQTGLGWRTPEYHGSMKGACDPAWGSGRASWRRGHLSSDVKDEQE